MAYLRACFKIIAISRPVWDDGFSFIFYSQWIYPIGGIGRMDLFQEVIRLLVNDSYKSISCEILAL
jgi:hypothetical protein